MADKVIGMRSQYTQNTSDDIDKLLKIKKKSPLPKMSFKTSLYLVFLSFMVSVLLTPRFTVPEKSLVEGELSPRQIKAQRSYDIVDEVATFKVKEAAERQSRSIFDYDPQHYDKVAKKLSKAFEVMKKEYVQTEASVIYTEAGFQKAKQEFEEHLELPVETSVFSYLVKAKFDWGIFWTTLKLLNLLKNKYVISQKNILEPEIHKGIVVRNVDSKEEFVYEELGNILDTFDAKTLVKRGTPKIYKGYPPQRIKLIGQLAAALIYSNISYNKEESRVRKEQAAQQIKPIIIQVKKNDVILRKDETVEKRHLIILRGIQKELTEQSPGFYVLFLTLFFFFFFQILSRYSLLNFTRFKPSEKDILMLGVLMFVTILVCRVYLFATGAIAEKVLWLPVSTFIYLVPVAAAVMIARLLLGMEASLIFALVVSIALSLLFEKPLYYTIYAFGSSLIGINGVSDCRAHNDIHRAGFLVAMTNMIIVGPIIVLSSISTATYQTIALEVLCGMGAGFFSGIVSSFFVIALVPLCEYLFHYTTDVKLLELSNLNNPILRDLMIRAPGSYHHSMMVGTLAENAAEAVGADALLARVGAYYHDIGKMKNPHYYIENQFGGYNIHDRQPPHLSKTMIMSHVKEGVKMGLERRLGNPIVNIIQQHHGTTAMMYFYAKAKKQYRLQVEEGEQELKPVEESDFRYEGPKPQTIEAAIVMMSDSVEAATRAMQTAHLPRLKVACEKIVNRLFTDGQLDESDLTLQDLHKIVDSFYHVLVGVYHRRISYPAGSGIQKETPYDANYNPKPAKEEDSDSKDQEMDDETVFKKMEK